jgi:hypothetical protein
MISRFAIGFAALALTVTAAQAQQCPDLKAKPITGRILLNEGFTPDPSRHSVIAGGKLNLTRCRSNWKGWVSRSPDLQLDYKTSGGTALSIFIESDMDTVLLVNDPSGTWHYDDDSGEGLNGKLRFTRARDGRYDIWVGLFKEGRGKLPSVSIAISED